MRHCTLVTWLALVSAAHAQVLTASKILGGSGNDAASALATDSQGNVFIAGTTTSGDFPLVNPLYPHLSEPALRMSADRKTFTPSSLTPTSVSAIAASADGRTMLAGTPSGIYRSVDAGLTWSAPQTTIPGQEVALAFDPTNPSNAYATVSTTNATLFYRSSDGAVTWQTSGVSVSPSSTNPSRIVIDPQNPSTILSLFSNGVYRSDDSGVTWKLVSVPEPASTSGQTTLSAVAIAASQPRTWYAVSNYASLVKSQDRGATWQQLPVQAGALAVNTLAVDPHDPNNIYFTNGAALQHSTDGGQTAQTAFKATDQLAISIAIDLRDSTHVFAADFSHLYASLDNGATWSTLLSGQFTAVLASQAGIFAAATVAPTLFLAKLDPTLSQVLFSTLIGPVQTNGIAIAVDANGNPLVTGLAASADFPVTANALQTSLSVAHPGFAVKVRADGGALLYSTFLNGITPGGAAFDSAGNVVIAGGAQGTQPVSSGAYQTTIPSGCTRPPVAISLVPGSNPNHAMVLKLNPDAGAVLWATYITGACGDSANAVRLDAAANVYLTGSTNSNDFPVTNNATTAKFPGGTNAGFVAELSADGSKLLYSTYFGAIDMNAGQALALDSRGNVYVGGTTQQKASAGALSVINSGACPPIIYIGPGQDEQYLYTDGFVMKLALDGTPPAFFATIGGGCQDIVSSLSLDGAGNIWVAGFTQSQDFPTLAPIGALGPGDGGFVAEIDPTGSKLLFGSFANVGAAAIADTKSGAYLATSVSVPTKTAGTSALAAHIDGSQLVPVALDSIAPPGLQQPLAGPGFTVLTIAPGQLILLKGRGIGPAATVNPPLTAAGTFPTSAAGVQVFFDGVPAPLATVGANQIECQAPFELDGRSVTQIQVVYNGQLSNNLAAAVAAQNISILAVVNEDFTPNTAANPAPVGSVATLFVTGLGQTIPAGVDGGVNPGPGITPRTPPVLYLNGPFATPLFIGSAPAQSTAVFQVNFTVPPPVNGSTYDTVSLSANNSFLQASAKLYVK